MWKSLTFKATGNLWVLLNAALWRSIIEPSKGNNWITRQTASSCHKEYVITVRSSYGQRQIAVTCSSSFQRKAICWKNHHQRELAADSFSVKSQDTRARIKFMSSYNGHTPGFRNSLYRTVHIAKACSIEQPIKESRYSLLHVPANSFKPPSYGYYSWSQKNSIRRHTTRGTTSMYSHEQLQLQWQFRSSRI